MVKKGCPFQATQAWKWWNTHPAWWPEWQAAITTCNPQHKSNCPAESHKICTNSKYYCSLWWACSHYKQQQVTIGKSVLCLVSYLQPVFLALCVGPASWCWTYAPTPVHLHHHHCHAHSHLKISHADQTHLSANSKHTMLTFTSHILCQLQNSNDPHYICETKEVSYDDKESTCGLQKGHSTVVHWLVRTAFTNFCDCQGPKSTLHHLFWCPPPISNPLLTCCHDLLYPGSQKHTFKFRYWLAMWSFPLPIRPSPLTIPPNAITVCGPQNKN